MRVAVNFAFGTPLLSDNKLTPLNSPGSEMPDSLKG